MGYRKPPKGEKREEETMNQFHIHKSLPGLHTHVHAHIYAVVTIPKLQIKERILLYVFN